MHTENLKSAEGFVILFPDHRIKEWSSCYMLYGLENVGQVKFTYKLSLSDGPAKLCYFKQ